MSEKETLTSDQKAPKKPNPFIGFIKRLVKEKPLGTVGGVIVLVLLITAIFADLSWLGLPDIGISPFYYRQIDVPSRLQPPSGDHWLGTDQLGRDVLSRIIYGARISLYVGLIASLLNIVVGAILGMISGYLSGTFDLVIQRFVDAFLAFPNLILLIAVMAVVGTGLWQVIFVIGISGGIGWSRTVRSAVFGIRENVYVEAARAVGATTRTIITRHIFPNILAVLVIAFTVSIGGNILTEASLSFLGLGIPPPYPSWGQMLSMEGSNYMYQAPWLAVWPGVALGTVVFGVSVWGDAVRDLIDPRLRGGSGGVGSWGMEKARKALIKLQEKATGKSNRTSQNP